MEEPGAVALQPMLVASEGALEPPPPARAVSAVSASTHRAVVAAAIVLDLAIIGIAYALASLPRFGASVLLSAAATPGGAALLFLAPLLWSSVLSARECYSPVTLVAGTRQALAVSTAVVSAWILTQLLAFLLKVTIPFQSRLVVAISLPLSLGLLLAARLTVVRAMARRSYPRLARGPVLVLGDTPRSEKIARRLAGRRGTRQVYIHSFPAVGPEDARELVRCRGFGEVVIEPEGRALEEVFDVGFACLDERAEVRIVSTRLQVATGRSAVGDLDGVPVMRLRRYDLAGPGVFLKRFIDVVGAGIGLLFLSPLLAAIALAIRATSPGPAIFRQERVGRNGRRFSMCKFRTMRDGNDSAIHREYLRSFIRGGSAAGQGPDGKRVYKLTADPRVTPVGAWLRRYSLDELPQLWNVLMGDMSLVGPRPCLPYEWEMYRPWQRRRLDVPPGCTGLWQVTARSSVPFEEMVVLDLHYAHYGTVGTDLWLIVQTVPAMIRGKGGF